MSKKNNNPAFYKSGGHPPSQGHGETVDHDKAKHDLRESEQNAGHEKGSKHDDGTPTPAR